MTKEPTASLLSGNVEYSDEIYTFIIIEGDVAKNKKLIVQLKDGSVFLLNDVETNVHDNPIKKIWWIINMNKLSVNLRNGADWIKQLLG